MTYVSYHDFYSDSCNISDCYCLKPFSGLFSREKSRCMTNSFCYWCKEWLPADWLILNRSHEVSNLHCLSSMIVKEDRYNNIWTKTRTFFCPCLNTDTKWLCDNKLVINVQCIIIWNVSIPVFNSFSGGDNKTSRVCGSNNWDDHDFRLNLAHERVKSLFRIKLSKHYCS